MTGRNFATWSKVPIEVKLLPSHRLGDRVLCPLKIAFQRDSLQIPEKDIPAL